ncbi:MAG: C39 family peptidase [Bacteroidetes bacterium]|nr:C39 family peptidase [Bacteroidota bacterium]MBS1539372.1 C39 family peptidase [Bacteroidota bacterium]
MSNRHNFFLNFDIEAQPDDTTCGPTCLHALYQYYRDSISLKEVINEVKSLKTGGTLAVMLGNHALKHGYNAHIYTYNLNIFDPSWFSQSSQQMVTNLKKQMRYKFRSKRLQVATKAYIKFLEAGGKLLLSELDEALIKKYLRKSTPILTGLSATYLYGNMREIPHNNKFDSIRGEPVGHFVIINGFDEATNLVYLADPMNPNPLKSQYYNVTFDRLINSIMLGIVTYDANLLVIEPKKTNLKII